jgi:putative ABC transport system substrate-binding protein
MGWHMQRREFIKLAYSAAIMYPLAVHGQSAKVPTIGVLLTGNPDPETFLKGFRAALRDIGYPDGRNIRLAVRSAEGKSILLPEKAAQLVGLKVDIIVAALTPAILAAKQATSDIPIVMAPAGEPVGTGLVTSLARPGGNVTGASAATAELAGKILELIREALPSARLVAVLANEADPLAKPFLEQIGQGARKLGLEVYIEMVRPETPLDAVFDEISRKKAEALIVQGSLQQKELFKLAIEHRLPSFSSNRQVANSGGLMTYARKQCGSATRSRRIRRQNPEGREASRPSCRAADHVRTGHKCKYCQGAWHYDSTNAVRPCRRGDRMTSPGSFLHDANTADCFRQKAH